MRAIACLCVMLAAIGTARADPAKFPTDNVVRKEMAAIRDLTVNVHTLVTHRRMPPAEASAYNAKIKAAVARIEQSTTLAGEAREEIEMLARSIASGARAVAREDEMDPIDGIVIIDESLAVYAKRFDHPEWKPLREHP